MLAPQMRVLRATCVASQARICWCLDLKQSKYFLGLKLHFVQQQQVPNFVQHQQVSKTHRSSLH